MTRSRELDQIVQVILADMAIKEKAAIANLDEEDVKYLQYAFDVCVIGKLGDDPDEAKDVMHRIWEVLQKIHKVRSVK